MNNHDQLQQQQSAAETARRRRRADAKRPASKKLTLRPGVVLFDPKDLEGGSTGDWRQSLTVELLEDNQEEDDDKEEEENDEGAAEERLEEDIPEDNQQDDDPDSPAAKQVRLRARVIEEICETEKSYVSDIRTLLDHYIVALEDNAHPIMQDAQIAVFFNNLRHLVMLNSKLLTDLLEIVQRRAAAAAAAALKKQAQGAPTPAGKRKSVKSPVAVAVQCEAEGVGAVFCRYAPLFKLYGGYAKDYEEVAALLQNFGRDTRLGFTKFLEACRDRSGSTKPFESLLIMPIQRIPRYKLLLERLSELTPSDHPDAAFLIEAVARVRAAASLINETVRRQENLETVLQAQQKFAGQLSLFTADRRLLKSGKLTKMSTKRQEDVMIHLFNDILLYSGVLLTGGYRVRRIVYLHSKAVGVKTELPTAIQALFEQQSRRRIRKDCGFVVTSREKTFILFAETPDIQHEWVDAIASAVKDAQKLKQAKRGEDGDADASNPEACEGPADAAALWVPDEIADELLGSTPPEHVDFVPLQSAIRSVDRVASKIEEISERRENARALATVTAKVGIDLSGRHFVRDGMLRKVCRSKVQTYYFVLLEDAMVYGRQGGLHKKKFRLIDLWECKVAEDTETMPGVITTVVNSNNAFCFYSPLKSFILLTESEQDKVRWTTDIRECIERNLRGQTHPRRASVRSELLVDNDDDSSSGYELEGGFVIKNGWLNVSGGAVTMTSGPSPSPTTSSSVGKKPRRLWITLTLQTISLGSTFKAAQPEETIPIELCEVAPLKNEKCFRLQFLQDTKMRTQTTYVFEALSLAEREEWVRALTHCISGGDELDLRRRSLKTATLAPIFMFDKVSNVCTICTHSFAVYRPRHHCRLCGSLVCGNCSRRRWTLSYSSSKKASRVCDSCAESTMSITRSFAVEM
ncbi:uncharacterized protein IUM83_12633 [Phytophthora cinnamomi]|uniref:uncharacterized protein n=1 Tax=Phytophthora cinnamomi TaxID=4785 RepID=UPI00355A889C|nr:hypothetical protein IUM83_12633 [Phytophthora cinnamomi]